MRSAVPPGRWRRRGAGPQPGRRRAAGSSGTMLCTATAGTGHVPSRGRRAPRREGREATMKIDVFPHILPRKYFDRLLAVAPPGLALQKRMSGIPVLVDLELRFAMMDRWDGYVQVLTLANPPIEVVAPPATSPDLARLANDEMAAIVARHPDRFPGFVASLPMNNPDAALAELERALDDLGATGVQAFSNVNGRPLDLPEYQPIFARMAERPRANS